MHPWLRDAGKEALQSLWFRGAFVWRFAGSRAVALTFDDGPHERFTPALADLLARYGVKATFFLVGRNVERHPQIARLLVAQGHALGGHTFNHREIVSLSASDLATELAQCREAIRAATGVDTVLFRPPRGKVSFASIRRVCRLGYRLVHWSKTYSDYHCDRTLRLVEEMRGAPPAPGDIILLHDHNPYTLDALLQMLPEWRARGLAFEALPAVG